METTSATTSHMKVNPNRKLPQATETSRAAKPVAKPDIAVQSDFHASTKLALKLAATPTVRADAVARAKAFIADPDYPNAKTVRAIARHLAEKIQSPPDSES